MSLTFAGAGTQSNRFGRVIRVAGVAGAGLSHIYAIINTSVYKYDASDGTQLASFTPTGSPFGVATDLDGNVFVTDVANGEVLKLDSDLSSVIWKSTASSGSVLSIAVDSSGNVFTGPNNDAGNAVHKFNSSGTEQWSVGMNGSRVWKLDCDASGHVLVGEFTKPGHLYKITPSGATTGTGFDHSVTGFNVIGVGVTGTGSTYHQHENLNDWDVYRIDSTGSTESSMLAQGNPVYDIAVDDQDNFYLAVRRSFSTGSNVGGGVYKVSSTGTVLLDLDGDMDNSRALSVDTSGNIYGGNADTGAIKKWDPSGNVLWTTTPAETGAVDYIAASPRVGAFPSHWGL